MSLRDRPAHQAEDPRAGEDWLAQLPSEIGQLTKLEELYLDNNFLAALSPEIGRLTKLRTLGLGNNRLTRISENLGQLTALTALYVDITSARKLLTNRSYGVSYHLCSG